jgi:hypothetical protein
MTSLIRRALPLGAMLVGAVILAGCGGGPMPTTAAGSPPAAVATGEAPTSGPTSGPTTGTTEGPAPTLTATTALVDVLPDSLGGTQTEKHALVGSDLAALDPSSATIFEQILQITGKPGADMTIGIAATAGASVVAIRIVGVSAQAIGEAMIAGRVLNATTTKDEIDLGGKHVTRVTTTTSPVPFYVYSAQDVSFTVAANDETVVAEALSKLP